MTSGRLPAGYHAWSRDGVRAFAWAAASPWLEEVLTEAGTLYGWSSRLAIESRPGRGPVNVVSAPVAGPDRSSRWAVRHYRRGGAAAPLFGDRYWGLGRTRPELELEASVHARARGVRTPAVVAGAAYRVGSSGAVGCYRADLVTELVPRARSLADTLLADGDSLAALARAGRLVRALHGAGVLHPDLNAGNVVLDEVGQAWVLDLDRARRLRHSSRQGALAMMARLERSLWKLARTSERPLSGEEWAALQAGFEEER